MNNYISCSRCNNKYINDAAHIQKDFGYNRLNRIYKLCVKCRDSKRENQKQPHRKEHAKLYYEANKETFKERARQHQIKTKEERTEIVKCEKCNQEISHQCLKRHQSRKICKLDDDKLVECVVLEIDKRET